jgi:hypothetical protein
LTRQDQISRGTAPGDDEDTLAVVALDLDHDAGLGVVQRPDPALAEQHAASVAGAMDCEHLTSLRRIPQGQQWQE